MFNDDADPEFLGQKYDFFDKEADDQMNGSHFLVISERISRIIGFAPETLLPIVSYTACQPASLTNGLPEKLFVYCDICEPRIIGDVKSPLLRVVSVYSKKYTFGSTQVSAFSAPHYIPLLHTGFRTIEIDIRDHLGRPIPFAIESLTVTLHFKRID